MASTSHTRKLFGAWAASFGIVAGIALSLAGLAHADDDDDDYDYYGPANEIVTSPDTYADPAAELVPWASTLDGPYAEAPQVDTTVQQSR